jgi:hypothetical protein
LRTTHPPEQSTHQKNPNENERRCPGTETQESKLKPNLNYYTNSNRKEVQYGYKK